MQPEAIVRHGVALHEPVAWYLSRVHPEVMVLAGPAVFFASAVQEYQVPASCFAVDCTQELPFSLYQPASLHGGDVVEPYMGHLQGR